ncbi:MAG: glycosyltransferase family 39 protein [Chloroflexi bacterium]|nr:glycosyltransferase family 39 protein [Chloroflexota bacterium]
MMRRLAALRTSLMLPGILVLTLALRAPSFLEPPWYDDEGIYAAVAHAVLNGSDIYREALDNRPPGLYLLYALLLGGVGFQPVFVKIGAALAVLAAQVILYRMGRRLWSPGAGLVAAASTGVLLSAPVLEGNIANAEVFMAVPVALGMLLALQGHWLRAGLALGVAFLIKQIAGLEFLAVALALLWWAPHPARPLAYLTLGFLAPLLVTLGYLAQQEVLADFLFAGFGYYLGYVQRGTRIPATPAFFALRTLLFLGLAALVWQHFRGQPRSGERVARGLPWLWLVCAGYGVFFTARPYPHYILQGVPPLAMVLAPYLTVWRTVPVSGWSGGRLVAACAAVAATVWLFVVIYIPWPTWASPERTVGYYQNFAELVRGRRTLQQYNDFFDRRVNRNLRIVSYLRQHAGPRTYVLVWGDEPWIYPLADIRNPTRYSVSYFTYEVPSGLDEVVYAVRVRKPRYIVWTKNKPLYPKLKEEIDAHYTVAATVENADILERMGTDRAQDRVQSAAPPPLDDAH